jgi:RNA polymerase sigma-70 factor (ECF subfamily)
MESASDAAVAEGPSAASTTEAQLELEAHRRALTGYCYRMLGSPFEAEDAVQDTFVRALRGLGRFEGRAALSSWLYRIATNVCLDMLSGRARRARPMDLGAAGAPEEANLNTLPEASWIEPIPQAQLADPHDPAELALARESTKLAFIAALQHLPPRQRAALILCEVLHWQASEAAELLETSVAAVNSALQRSRSTLAAARLELEQASGAVEPSHAELLERYVGAFERYDLDALTEIIREDASQSMPPYDLWLQGRDDIFAWWLGPGIGCRGSRLLPAPSANGSVAFGQYKASESPPGFEPWALQVLELRDGRIGDLVFFLDTERLFPLFGLPDRLAA